MTAAEYLKSRGFTYSMEQMQEAFGAICDKDDWKRPIETTAHDGNVDLLCQAIRFMTGTEATVTKQANSKHYRLTAPGYRLGPAA